MPKYFYTAKNREGETESGVFFAKDKHQLAHKLRKEGLILIEASIEETKEERGLRVSIPFLNRISLREKLLMTRNLQVMVASGLPLSRALRILKNQTKNRKFKKVLFEIQEDIKKGKSFSESLEKYPGVFSELYRNMVKVGEEGGMLEKVLSTLALQMEKEHELKSKITGALIYPAVIIAAMIGIGVLMLIMVVPKLKTLFEQIGAQLPISTRIVIFLGTILSEKWYLVLGGALLLIFFFWQALKTEPGKRIFDTFFLKIPVISPIIRKSNSAVTVRTLASLISSGVPVVHSLQIISGTLGNFYFRRAMLGASEAVKKGDSLSEALRPYQKIYPVGVIEMIKVGEETGETSAILLKLADFFEEEVARVTKNLVSVLEPVLMVIVGATVGFFAISMVQPMYSMLSGF